MYSLIFFLRGSAGTTNRSYEPYLQVVCMLPETCYLFPSKHCLCWYLR